MLNQLVADIVANDYRTAGVFREFGISFCCGGHIPLSEACQNKGIAEEDVLQRLHQLYTTPSGDDTIDTWPARKIMEFITGYHHAYLREALPRITAYAYKVASRHGEHHPQLLEIFRHFGESGKMMMDHAVDKEARIFPALNSLFGDEAVDVTEFKQMMEHMIQNHAAFTVSLRRTRELTADFTPPEWGCTTFRILFQELEAFETDVLQHIHLEQTVLLGKVNNKLTQTT